MADNSVPHEDNGQIQYTDQELRLLRQLQSDAAVQRGIPGAVLSSGIAYLCLRKAPNVSRGIKFVTYGLSATYGYVTGLFTYGSTAQARLLDQLPEDSQLRRAINRGVDSRQQQQQPLLSSQASFQQQQQQNPYPVAPSNDDFPPEQPEIQPMNDDRDYPNYQASSDSGEQRKGFNSYEELRRRNRSPHNSPMPYSEQPAVPDDAPPQEYPDVVDPPMVKAPRKRYNKYGDEIMD